MLQLNIREDTPYYPQVADDVYDAFMKDFNDFLSSGLGKDIKSDIRRRLFNFSVKSAYKPAGSTHVNIIGFGLWGPSPKTNNDKALLARRALGQEIYSKAIADGFFEYLKAVGFRVKPNYDYDTFSDACLDVELNSMSSKGPFDNGPIDQAVRVVDDNLRAVLGNEPMPKEWCEEVLRRARLIAQEYTGLVDPEWTYDPSKLPAILNYSDIEDTMRGFPFLCAGSSHLEEKHVKATSWMFQGHINPKTLKKYFKSMSYIDEKTKKRKCKATVDDFIEFCLSLLYKQGKKLSDWYDLRHTIVVPLSRDQGSPFEIDIENMKWTPKRKARKYRIVQPISAFAQAALMLAAKPLVDAAPHKKARIGMLSPDINDARFGEYLRSSRDRNKVIMSSDFTSFDARQGVQRQAIMSQAYSEIFNDPFVKDALSMMGYISSFKSMILPTRPTDSDGLYSQFPNKILYKVKGSKSFAMRRLASGIENKSIRDELEAQASEDFDYVARMIIITQGWLASGLFTTNTLGSDIDRLQGQWSFSEGLDDNLDENEAQTSGDDLLQQISKDAYDSLGFQGVLNKIAENAEKENAIVNPRKQCRTLYKGYPVVDFLQHVRPQINDLPDGPVRPYKKINRMLSSLPASERQSRLPLPLQITSPMGRLDSALCEENLDLAANVIVNAGRNFIKYAEEKRYLVPIPAGALKQAAKEGVDLTKAAYYDGLLGLGKLFSVALKERDNLAGSIAREAVRLGMADDMADYLETELDARAPHKKEMIEHWKRAIAEATGKPYKVDETATGYKSLIPKLAEKVNDLIGGRLNPSPVSILFGEDLEAKPSKSAEVEE